MENSIKFNDKIYKGQLIWKNTIFGKKDYKNKLFVSPANQKNWGSQFFFLDKIAKVNNLIELKKQNNVIHGEKKNCLLCEKQNISDKLFALDNYIWNEDIIHYVKEHNIKPSDKFLDFIFDLDIDSFFNVKLNGRLLKNDNEHKYLKIEKNQIMILDALMKHGGYAKKYYDMNDKKISRYSEHAGFLEISDKLLQEIVVSGNTIRVDKGDEEIYLPGDMPNSFDYYYVFHTHPPTPKPGGRAIDGIIYEFPSIGDMFYFIDHFNNGKIIGSIVMTSEGLYNIRKKDMSKKKIKIDENKFYNDVRKIIHETNKNSINLFGTKFNTYEFYSIIAQEKKFINKINEILNLYDLHIDFFSRTKDFKNKWIVDSVYLPIYDK
jgi:hypothetical protein